jgi:hypothetical protein
MAPDMLCLNCLYSPDTEVKSELKFCTCFRTPKISFTYRLSAPGCISTFTMLPTLKGDEDSEIAAETKYGLCTSCAP